VVRWGSADCLASKRGGSSLGQNLCLLGICRGGLGGLGDAYRSRWGHVEGFADLHGEQVEDIVHTMCGPVLSSPLLCCFLRLVCCEALRLRRLPPACCRLLTRLSPCVPPGGGRCLPPWGVLRPSRATSAWSSASPPPSLPPCWTRCLPARWVGCSGVGVVGVSVAGQQGLDASEGRGEGGGRGVGLNHTAGSRR
jgi:hypothetical protein